MKVSILAAVNIVVFAAMALAQTDEWKPVVSKDGIDVYYRAIDDPRQEKHRATLKVNNTTKRAFDVLVEIQQGLPSPRPGVLIPPIAISRWVKLHVKARSEATSDEVLMDGPVSRVRLFCMSKTGAKEKCDFPGLRLSKDKP